MRAVWYGCTTIVVSGTWMIAGPGTTLPATRRSPQNSGVGSKSPSSAQYTGRVPARASPAGVRSASRAATMRGLALAAEARTRYVTISSRASGKPAPWP